MDWNNDGKKDLLTGEYYGYIRVYLNTGTDAAPAFDQGSNGYYNVQVGGVDFSVGRLSKPDVVDWDNDGDLDLLCGEENGRVYLLLNQSTKSALPVFAAWQLLADGGGVLDVGAEAHPVAVDWNGDGRKDLLVGGADGRVHFYANVGSDAVPAFNGSTVLDSVGSPLSVGAFARPEVVDWDGDGQLDVLVGNQDGMVSFYQGVTSALPFLVINGVNLNDASGDGDGSIDPGETLLVCVNVSNRQVLAQNVTGVLSSDSPYLTIAPSNTSFGSIGFGESARNAAVPFVVSVSGAAPASQEYTFRLDLMHDGLAAPRRRELTVGRYVLDASGRSSWVNMSSGTPLTLGDDTYVTLSIGFDFPFYGTTHNQVHLCSNGFLTFGSPNVTYSNTGIPEAADPNALVAPFWDDLNPSAGGFMRYGLFGTAPNRYWVAAWNSVPHFSSEGSLTFQVILQEDGVIRFQYGAMTGAYANGNSATIGIERHDGRDGVQHSYNQPDAVAQGMALVFSVANGSGDSDSDSIPDEAERFYFNDLDETGADDSDGDGMNNADELRCGTDPANSNSVLCVQGARAVSSNRYEILWQSVPGRQYRVQSCDSLSGGAWNPVTPAPVASGGGASCTTVSIHSATQFLRVEMAP